MRILFVAPYVPSQVRVRPFQWIRALSRLGHAVHLVALRPPEDEWTSLQPLQDACEQIEIFPLSRLRTVTNAVRALTTGLPLQAAYSGHPDAQARVSTLARSGRFDVVHVEHLRGVVLGRDVTGTPRVLDAVDSISHLFEQASRHAPSRSQRLLSRLELPRTRRLEAHLPSAFDLTLVTSDADAAVFRHLGTRRDAKLAVLTNGVDHEHFAPAREPATTLTVLFTGKMSYHANAAAALRLAGEIMPRVWSAFPEARLLVAGKDPGPELVALRRDPRVEITGFMPDLRQAFRTAAVAVAPLLYGAGIQNKVLEAMASGLPVVTTPAVAAGLRQAEPGADLLVGESSDQLADHVIGLLRSATTRAELGRRGRGYVLRHHDWLELGRRLVGHYAELCAPDQGRRTSARTA